MIDFAKVDRVTIPEGRVRSIRIADVQVWKSAFLNLVPTSIDTDGTVYNDVGYMENYRLNSSGGLSSSGGAVHSGFIPFTFGDVIRAAGSKAAISTSGHYIAFYDESFACLKSITTSAIVNASSTDSSYVARDDGTYLLAVGTLEAFFSTNYSDIDTSTIKYIRVSMPDCSGDDFIVTLNEEIS